MCAGGGFGHGLFCLYCFIWCVCLSCICKHMCWVPAVFPCVGWYTLVCRGIERALEKDGLTSPTPEAAGVEGTSPPLTRRNSGGGTVRTCCCICLAGCCICLFICCFLLAGCCLNPHDPIVIVPCSPFLYYFFMYFLFPCTHPSPPSVHPATHTHTQCTGIGLQRCGIRRRLWT